MLIHDDEGSDEDGSEEAEHSHLDAIEVSAHSIVGLTTPHTTKLQGSIRECSVAVLIDIGATHNFLSMHLVEPLGLIDSGNRGTGVILGNRKTERSYGIWQDVELVLPELRIVENFFPLERGSTNVILGMQWLRQLGDMQVNRRELIMSFRVGGTPVVLRGEPDLTRSEASLQAIARSLPDISAGYVVVLASLAATNPLESHVNPSLDDLLGQYVDVFSMPAGLPPSRDHEHRIVLKGGTEPVCVRAYHYPQLQKDEMERLVDEMLEAGIIRAITGPFSSLVLLVKKKDGGWRFCVDYRALNKSTVLDKFVVGFASNSYQINLDEFLNRVFTIRTKYFRGTESLFG